MPRSPVLPLLAVLCAGCPTSEPPADDPTPPPESGCLTPEDGAAGLQTALIEPEGDVICLEAGTWELDTELALDLDGVTVRGAGATETVLDFSGQDVGGNGLLISGDDVVLEDLTVQNTPGDGIRTNAVNNITFRRVIVRWDAEASLDNGAYGLYPVGGDGVLVEDCVVSGARDAGIYVGQSTNIVVRNNEVFGNVAGIEIENSTDAEVHDNHAHDNTAGVLVFNLPGLPVQDGRRTVVRDNTIENNDLANFAEPGTVVAGVPLGIGVMILAADETVVRDNVIRGNDTAAVLVISYTDFAVGPYDDPDFDPWSEGTCVTGNTFASNGEDPDGLLSNLVDPRPAPDVLWDGCPAGAEQPELALFENTADDDGSSVFYRVGLPPCGSLGVGTDDVTTVTSACGD